MLPAAIGFIDPFLSTGIAFTLQNIERLASAFEKYGYSKSIQKALRAYEKTMLEEMDFLNTLIAGCYHAFGNFDILNAFTMYYFAGAIFAETKRRNGDDYSKDHFLSSHAHEPALRNSLFKNFHILKAYSENRNNIEPDDSRRFIEEIRKDLAPLNLAGLCDPAKLNMYPFVTL